MMKIVLQRYKIAVGTVVRVFSGCSGRHCSVGDWRICELFDDYAMCCCSSITDEDEHKGIVKITFESMNKRLSFEFK